MKTVFFLTFLASVNIFSSVAATEKRSPRCPLLPMCPPCLPGYERMDDPNGCPSCMCAYTGTTTREPGAICPYAICPMPCGNGFRADNGGCKICSCKI